MRSGTAPCGLRYAVRRGGSAVGYCALSMRCGTRDEDGFGNGIAHFAEHTMFRGTARKSASVINSYLDRLGGELNAYTTKEEIVLHATVLKEDLGKAAGLLFELATEATFPDAEIETERGVVLDEIISYKDNPAEDVYDKFEGMLSEGHPLGLPILGTSASVRRIKPADLRRFARTFFIPARMAFTVVADLDEKVMEKRVLRLVEKLFGEIPGQAGDDAKNNRAFLNAPVIPGSTGNLPFSKTVDKRNHEVNAVIGNRAPSLYDSEDRITAAVLCNILGGARKERLGVRRGVHLHAVCRHRHRRHHLRLRQAQPGTVPVDTGQDSRAHPRGPALRAHPEGLQEAAPRAARHLLRQRRGAVPVHGQEPPRLGPHRHQRRNARPHRSRHTPAPKCAPASKPSPRPPCRPWPGASSTRRPSPG